MSFKESLFKSETEKSFKLWKKGSPETQNPLIFSAEAHKISTHTNLLEKRFFFIRGDYLCYKRNSSDEAKIIGYLDLRWTRVEFKKVEQVDLKPYFDWYIMIIKNLHFSKIFLSDLEEKNIWRKALRVCCAMTDFHDEYRIEKLIGQGSYGRVKKILNIQQKLTNIPKISKKINFL